MRLDHVSAATEHHPVRRIPISLKLTKEEIAAIIPSLRWYCRDELEVELSEMRAGFLLDYLVQEVGPFAYNRGVADAEAWVRAGVDELPATCFADGLTYWKRRP